MVGPPIALKTYTLTFYDDASKYQAGSFLAKIYIHVYSSVQCGRSTLRPARPSSTSTPWPTSSALCRPLTYWPVDSRYRILQYLLLDRGRQCWLRIFFCKCKLALEEMLKKMLTDHMDLKRKVLGIGKDGWSDEGRGRL